MLELGQKVRYVRQDKESNIVEGIGSVKAVALDPENRPIVQIKDGEDVFNVPYAAIDPDEDFVKEYGNFVKEIDRLTEEGNAKSKEVVTEYNAKIAEIVNDRLGEPIEL